MVEAETLGDFTFDEGIFKLSELKSPEYNPKVNIRDDAETYAALYNSIDVLKYIDPIIVNIRDGKNIIVSGNQRYAIMCDMVKDKGISEDVATVKVVIVDYDEATEMAANIGLNKIKTDWISSKLKEDLEYISSLDSEIIKLTGFTDEELNKMLECPAIEDKDEEVLMGNKDFFMKLKLASEAEQLYDFYIAAYGEEKLKEAVMKILGG